MRKLNSVVDIGSAAQAAKPEMTVATALNAMAARECGNR